MAEFMVWLEFMNKSDQHESKRLPSDCSIAHVPTRWLHQSVDCDP
jgi:hypothetical protein